MNFLQRLDLRGKNVLILSCGGGYDIFCGVIPYLDCIDKYNDSNKPKSVYLASFSFTSTQFLLKFEEFVKDGFIVSRDTINIDKYNTGECKILELSGKTYFPELRLSEQINDKIFCINTETDLDTYETFIKTIVDQNDINVIIVVDGGCDSILSGVEEELATPVEDVMTVYAIKKIVDQYNSKDNNNKIKTYLTCLGTTVELIKDGDFEKRVEAIKKQQGLIDCVPLKAIYQNKESGYEIIQRYIDIFLKSKTASSIINSSVVASLQGHEGKYVNPLLKGRIPMTSQNFPNLSEDTSKLWIFDLDTVARNIIYLKYLDKIRYIDDIDMFVMSLNHTLHPSSYNLNDFYKKEDTDRIKPYIEELVKIIKNDF